MLRNISTLIGHTIQAADGPDGKVTAFCLDLKRWVVRYAAADEGRKGSAKRVLISTQAVLPSGIGPGTIGVNLTKQQIRHIPAMDLTAPVDRKLEAHIVDFFGWPRYWEAAPLGRKTPAPAAGGAMVMEKSSPLAISTGELFGYTVAASDGIAGTVFDAVIDDATWDIRFLAVQTAERKSLIMPQSITEIREDASEILVNLMRRQVEYGVGYRDTY